MPGIILRNYERLYGRCPPLNGTGFSKKRVPKLTHRPMKIQLSDGVLCRNDAVKQEQINVLSRIYGSDNKKCRLRLFDRQYDSFWVTDLMRNLGLLFQCQFYVSKLNAEQTLNDTGINTYLKNLSMVAVQVIDWQILSTKQQVNKRGQHLRPNDFPNKCYSPCFQCLEEHFKGGKRVQFVTVTFSSAQLGGPKNFIGPDDLGSGQHLLSGREDDSQEL